MSQKHLMYFTLWLLVQLLVKINCQMIPNSPGQRRDHTATLIDNKLYILGGFNSYNDFERDFFYLDVSVSFNTRNLLWKDLSNIDIVPSHSRAASVKGGANNNTLFLYGGFNVMPMDLVYSFNPQSNSWNIPNITGDIPIRKSGLTGIIDHKGIMYLWGGYNYDENYVILNDMLILDTINLVWGKGSSAGAPAERFLYGATLLADNNIIYVGGVNKAQELALNQVYLYDTINNYWSANTTSGEVPSGRDSFSTVLGLDGQRIIIFGGSATSIVQSQDLKPEDSLYELNLINFEWRIPKVFGQIPESRMSHKANVIGKYMVISFGEGYNQSIESDILLLDISNVDEYTWTNEFYPSLSSPSPPPTVSTSNVPAISLPSSISQSAMIGAIVGSISGVALLSFGGLFLYKWNKSRHKEGISHQIHL